MTLSVELQPAPDIAFLRNTGIALVTLALLAGSISLVGSINAGETQVPIKLASNPTQSTEFTLKQAEPSISPRGVFQGHYINPNGVMQ